MLAFHSRNPEDVCNGTSPFGRLGRGSHRKGALRARTGSLSCWGWRPSPSPKFTVMQVGCECVPFRSASSLDACMDAGPRGGA